MNLNKVYLIDVIEGMRQIQDGYVDIIIADPPYNIGKDFGINKDNLKIDDYIIWCKLWMDECVRVLKNSGTLFIYGFSENLAYLSVNLSIDKRWLIWHYTNKTTPNLNFWQRSYESIIVAWKDKNERVFNCDSVREPYTDSFLNNAAGKVRNNTKGRFSNGNKETIYNANINGALPRDVIKIPALAGGAGASERWFYCYNCSSTYFSNEANNHKNCEIIKHSTQKPMELSKKLISSCRPKEDGLILVPFAGSGSECLVAKKLGMDFIGFDNNNDYVLMSNSLIEKFS